MHGAIFQLLCTMLFAISVAASPLQDATRGTVDLGKRDRNVDGGSLYCLSENNGNKQGDSNYFMTKEGAEDLATRACDYWNTTNAQLHAQLPVVNDTIGFTAGYLHDNLDPQYGRIVVMAGYSANERCNTTLNFNDADFHKKCGTGLYTAINGCDLQKNNVPLWKQGGRFYHGCVSWTISKMAVDPLLP